jgi:hypothetical protein
MWVIPDDILATPGWFAQKPTQNSRPPAIKGVVGRPNRSTALGRAVSIPRCQSISSSSAERWRYLPRAVFFRVLAWGQRGLAAILRLGELIAL